MKLTFCGAARIVTGSNYFIEAKGIKVLVDCGMFQGRKETTRLNYKPFPFNPGKIDYLFLTHAHIDHSGLIPKLYKHGFRGKILATSATTDLCKVMLEDSAGLQENDNKRENRWRKRKGLKPREPLYTKKDAKACFSLFKKVDYDKIYEFGPVKVRYRDAGHIVGSASIEMFVNEGDGDKKIVFSGDLGQWDVPIVKNPTLIEDADYVLVESTYGDRLHEDVGIRDDLLLKHVRDTFQRGGRLMIPSFAIERTQELLYSFNKLIKQGKFPNERIFLDSPLAIKATEIFKKHQNCCFDKEALTKYKNPFNFPQLVYTLKTPESKKLNEYKQPCVIIAGSGMVTGGRIRHHLRHGISDPKNMVLFVGYQAQGTTGRYILEGAKSIRMMGMRIPVRAKIDKINSFSAHADYQELVKWIKGFKKKPKKVFVVHGEEQSSRALKVKLEKQGFKCYIPRLYEKVEL
jgi:metallo-beta-lactamase family protein